MKELGCTTRLVPSFLFLLMQVDGYSEHYWVKGRVARDGVPPRDDFMELEFREGEKSIFDDPRFLDQEGPTLGGPDS